MPGDARKCEAMALAEDDYADGVEVQAPRGRLTRWRWRVSLALLIVIVAALAAAWFSRERIAGDVIAGMLEDYDLPAQYEIESIGPERQVLTDVVIGDPLLPDLTVERVIVHLRYRFGTPAIGRIELHEREDAAALPKHGVQQEDRASLGEQDEA